MVTKIYRYNATCIFESIYPDIDSAIKANEPNDLSACKVENIKLVNCLIKKAEGKTDGKITSVAEATK